MKKKRPSFQRIRGNILSKRHLTTELKIRHWFELSLEYLTTPFLPTVPRPVSIPVLLQAELTTDFDNLPQSS